MIDALLIVAALGAGLVAGFFFSFSFVVMGSLARLPPAQGIAAMNTINVVVLNPWFFGAFFGTALVSLVVGVLALAPWTASSPVMLAASLTYLVGAIGVTMAFNVPLNNALAKVDAGSEAGHALWQRYLKVWTAWNHVRTAAPLAACALFILALP
jgi:uncharacterized membrane protein